MMKSRAKKLLNLLSEIKPGDEIEVDDFTSKEKTLFNKLNKEFFQGKLKGLNLLTTKDSTVEEFGLFVVDSKTLIVNTKTASSPTFFKFALKHEMIHAYVATVLKKDDGPHGKLFNKKHKEIFGRTFTWAELKSS